MSATTYNEYSGGVIGSDSTETTRESYPPVRKTRTAPKGNKGNARKAYFVETGNDYPEYAED